MEIKYQIIKEHQLLINKYYGVFSVSDYYHCVVKMMQLPDWAYVTKVLNDLRDVAFLFSVLKKMDELAQIRKGTIRKELQTVLLVDTPETTVSAHLYAEKLSDMFNIWYCSTIEFAIEILSLEMGEKELKNIIDNLPYKL